MPVHRRYVVILLLCLLWFVTSGFAFARTAWFAHHVSFFDHAVDERMAIRHLDAEVLFVGDSSLQFGVMPTVVQQRSGLSGYNLSLSAPAFETVGEAMLDAYLANNRRPRILVLYIAASTDPEHPSDRLFDSVGFLLRHEFGTPMMWRFLLRHPSVLYQYPYTVWRLTAEDTSFSTRPFLERQQILRAERGFLPYWLPNGATSRVPLLADGCMIPARPVAPPLAYLKRFRERYERDGTTVVVYVPPFADCDESFPLAARAYQGIADNMLYQLPHGDFIGDIARVHLAPAGAARNSVIVGDFVAGLARRLAAEPLIARP